MTTHQPRVLVNAYRLLQSAARAYRRTDDPPDPLPLHDARALDRHLASGDGRRRRGRGGEAPQRLREALHAPGRIAPDGGAARDGYGFVGRALSRERLQQLLDQRPHGATFNDVLLAASMVTVERWNAAHGIKSDRVPVTMPVNTRPRDWFGRSSATTPRSFRFLSRPRSRRSGRHDRDRHASYRAQAPPAERLRAV